VESKDAKNAQRKGTVFYDQSGYIVRESVKSDVNYLKYHLRRSDLLEIWSSHHYTPEKALEEGFENSLMCFTVCNGLPIAMFGLNPDSLIGNKATIWLLSSYGLDNVKVRFVRNCRKFIDMMLSRYGYLENYVDVRNKKTIQWLKFLGAEFSDPVPYGVDCLPFVHFSFRK
jgi:hypothetical protein